MKEFILSIFGLDYESRKDLFTIESLKFTIGFITFFLIIGLLNGLIEKI